MMIRRSTSKSGITKSRQINRKKLSFGSRWILGHGRDDLISTAHRPSSSRCSSRRIDHSINQIRTVYTDMHSVMMMMMMMMRSTQRKVVGKRIWYHRAEGACFASSRESIQFLLSSMRTRSLSLTLSLSFIPASLVPSF